MEGGMARGRRRGIGSHDDYGGYSGEQVDAALRETLRSDWPSLALRLVVVGVVYTLLARAILDGMSSPYLVLPLLSEVLLIFWLGWLMTRTLVDCPSFRKSAGSLWLTVFWTAVAGAVVLGALAFDRQNQALDSAQIVPRAQRVWAVIQHHQLHWALVAMLLGLLISTAMDILRWRDKGGVFFWASITHVGFRMGLLIVLIPVLGFFGIFLAEVLLWLAERFVWWEALSAQLWAWPVWVLLLVLELGTVVVSVLMHRDLLAKAAAG
jgi:hypothetical protein